jgi:hypothetical protein
MKKANKASVSTLVTVGRVINLALRQQVAHVERKKNQTQNRSRSQHRPGPGSRNSVERGLKQADNRNAQSTARQALVGEASELGAVELDSRTDQRKSHGPDVQLAAVPVPPSEESESAYGAEGAGDEDDELITRTRPSDEDELITRSLAGNGDSFETLVRRHNSRVFSIIGSFFRRRDMVEDIAQEVFAKAFFSLGTFTLGRSFAGGAIGDLGFISQNIATVVGQHYNIHLWLANLSGFSDDTAIEVLWGGNIVYPLTTDIPGFGYRQIICA